jgi:hypothetical protein
MAWAYRKNPRLRSTNNPLDTNHKVIEKDDKSDKKGIPNKFLAISEGN